MCDKNILEKSYKSIIIYYSLRKIYEQLPPNKLKTNLQL